MFTFRSLFLWMHVVTVVCWVGGIIFTAWIAGPVLVGKRAMDGGGRYQLRILHRFNRLSRELLFVVLFTGIANLLNRGILLSFNFSSTYLTIVGTKFTILMVLAGLQVYYSLKLVPRLVDAINASEQHEETVNNLRKKAFVISCLMVLLGVSAIFMGLNLGYL